MTDIVIVGIGQTEVGEHWGISLRDLALDAIQDALKDASGLKPQAVFVGNMLAPNLSNQAHLGALIADYAGLTGIEAVTVEAAGASGGAALRQGYLAIASGMVDVALVVGVEKFTDKIGSEVEEAVAPPAIRILKPCKVDGAAQAALLMKRYMHEEWCPCKWVCWFRAHCPTTALPIKMPCSAKLSKPRRIPKRKWSATHSIYLTWPQMQMALPHSF